MIVVPTVGLMARRYMVQLKSNKIFFPYDRTTPFLPKQSYKLEGPTRLSMVFVAHCTQLVHPASSFGVSFFTARCITIARK